MQIIYLLSNSCEDCKLPCIYWRKISIITTLISEAELPSWQGSSFDLLYRSITDFMLEKVIQNRNASDMCSVDCNIQQKQLGSSNADCRKKCLYLNNLLSIINLFTCLRNMRFGDGCFNWCSNYIRSLLCNFKITLSLFEKGE